MSPSARKIHVGIVGAPRGRRHIDPASGLPRLERVLVPSEPFVALCPCGGPCRLRHDRDALTYLECGDCGSSNHQTRRAAID